MSESDRICCVLAVDYRMSAGVRGVSNRTPLFFRCIIMQSKGGHSVNGCLMSQLAVKHRAWRRMPLEYFI